MLDFLPIPVTVNSTIEQESQFRFKKQGSKYCAKQSKYGTKPDAINEYVFFNPTSRRDGTITQFIRIMFYLAFPLQSSQYFHWLLYWNFSEQLFWDKFGLKKNWQRSKLFSVSIRVKCIAIALLSITQNIDYFKIEWGLTEIKGLRTKETIFMIKENV